MQTNLIKVTQVPLVFVTGASRSGTTMVARMFGGHSRILALNETHYFGSLCDPEDAYDVLSDALLVQLGASVLARHRRGLWCGDPTAGELSEVKDVLTNLTAADRTCIGIFGAVTLHLATTAGKEFACEQTPRNVFYARRLLQLFPKARIVHIVRDPRAVLASQKNRWKLRALGANHLPAKEMLRNRVNYHPFTIARLWMEANLEALKLENHERFRIVRFEDLAASPEEKAAELFEFLGLNFEPAVLDLPRWGSSNVSHSADLRGVSKDVVDRWSSVLSTSETLVCEAITAPLMHRFGYARKTAGSLRSFDATPAFLSYPFHVAAVLAFNPARAWTQIKALYKARVSVSVSQ